MPATDSKPLARGATPAAARVRYKTSAYTGSRIDPVELIRETAKQVLIRESHSSGRIEEARYLKSSAYCQLHESWEAARAYLIAQTVIQINEATDNLASLEQKLVEIRNMQPERLQ